MIAFVVITLYPVLNTLAISLNDGIDAVRGGIYLWPRKFTLNNYKTVLTKQNMLQGAYITVLRTICLYTSLVILWTSHHISKVMRNTNVHRI